MNFSNRNLAVLTLAVAASAPAVAAEGFRFTLGAGLTGGGEKLATVQYTDGSTQSVRSGGLVHLFGGFEYQAGDFALQANLGYHVDDTSAKNGSVKFSRMPVEVLGFWHVNESIRLGGGLRKATGAKITSSGAASSVGSLDFDAKLGLVLQGEYFFGGDKVSTYVRYVSEDYEAFGVKVGGNHVGVGLTYRF